MYDLTIRIDLNDLTQEKLEATLQNIGVCDYRAPCIIGALVSEEDRVTLQESDCGASVGGHVGVVPDCRAPCTIGAPLAIELHVGAGTAIFPDGQKDDAAALQRAFDAGDEAEVRRIAAKYIDAPKGETT